jgi:CheY-like chemotaxis protein
LCELLGYSLTVRSRIGFGTEFTIDLMPPDAATRLEDPRTAGTTDEPRNAATHERLVLIVDDEADSRILLTHYVEDFGCRAIATHSAANAIKLARELKPDLITLDLMMPGRNGWEILALLKADPELAEIPVVVVSIIAQESRATLVGVLDLLQKPVDRAELFSVLRRNLGSSRSRILVVDDSADSRHMLENMLADTASEVRTAANGQDALRVLREFTPDLVILDLVMPVMDGLTFLEVFRGTPRFRDVPVIVVSAKDLAGDERERIQRHTTALLQKGSALESDLRGALASVLSSTSRPASVRAGDGDVSGLTAAEADRTDPAE